MRLDPATRLSGLPELRRRIWRWLEAAPGNPADSWRTAALATAGTQAAHVRTVILRAVRARLRELEFHTDSRAEKLAQLRRRPQVEWLFYDPIEKIQLRAAGRAEVHIADSVAREAWSAVPIPSRANYLQLCHPGKILKRPPAPGPAVVHPADAEPFFAVVITRIERLDWLWLHPAGHRRAAFQWRDGRRSAHWLGP